jgi:hypothetical protein
MEPAPSFRSVLPWVAAVAGVLAVPYWFVGGLAATGYGMSSWVRDGWSFELWYWCGTAIVLLGLPACYVRTVWLATVGRSPGPWLKASSGLLILTWVGWMVATVGWPAGLEARVTTLVLSAPLPVWIYLLVRRARP